MDWPCPPPKKEIVNRSVNALSAMFLVGQHIQYIPTRAVITISIEAYLTKFLFLMLRSGNSLVYKNCESYQLETFGEQKKVGWSSPRSCGSAEA